MWMTYHHEDKWLVADKDLLITFIFFNDLKD